MYTDKRKNSGKSGENTLHGSQFRKNAYILLYWKYMKFWVSWQKCYFYYSYSWLTLLTFFFEKTWRYLKRGNKKATLQPFILRAYNEAMQLLIDTLKVRYIWIPILGLPLTSYVTSGELDNQYISQNTPRKIFKAQIWPKMLPLLSLITLPIG